MVSRSHNFAFLFCLWFAILQPLTARAQPSTSPRTDGFEQVSVDLAGRTFDRVLPFDVPFQLHGALPNTVTAVTVEVLRPNDTPIDRGGWPESTWQRVLGVPASEFRVTIPPLDAEQYYKFEFQLQSPVDNERLEDYQQQARRLVESQLRGRPGDLSSEELDTLDRELVRLLRDILTASETLVAAFSAREAGIGARALFDNGLQAVLTAQESRNQALSGYQRHQQRLQDALSSIRHHSVVVKLHQALLDLAFSNESIAIMVSHPAFALLRDPDAAIVHRALGYRLGDESMTTPLSSIYESAQVRRFRLSYKETGEFLSYLNAVLNPRERPPGYISNTLNDEETADLRSLFETGPFRGARDALFEVEGSVAQIEDRLAERDTGLDRLIDGVQLAVRTVVIQDGTTVGPASTHRNSYVAADAGFAFVVDGTGTAVPYLGTNIYFRPINKDAALSQRGGFARRFSLTVGLTVTEPGGEAAGRLAFFGSQALLLGGGFRLTRSLRLGGGALLYKVKSDGACGGTGVRGYVSFSFDLDVASTLGQVFSGGT